MTTGDVALIIALALGILIASNLPGTWRRPASRESSTGYVALVEQLGAQHDEIRQLKAEIDALKQRLVEADLQRNAMQIELEAWRRQNQRIAELESENEGLRRAITSPVKTGFMSGKS